MFDSGPCDWMVLPLLLPTPTTQFSLDHKRRSRKRNRKKWKRSDSSDSDSVELDSAYDSDFRLSLGHKPASSPGVSVCQKTTNRRNPCAMHHGKDQALSQCIMGRLKPKNETARSPLDPFHDPLRTSFVLVSLVPKSDRARLGTRQVISSLTIPTTTLTPSPVKTSLCKTFQMHVIAYFHSNSPFHV